jgi:hypothetical protein
LHPTVQLLQRISAAHAAQLGSRLAQSGLAAPKQTTPAALFDPARTQHQAAVIVIIIIIFFVILFQQLITRNRQTAHK